MWSMHCSTYAGIATELAASRNCSVVPVQLRVRCQSIVVKFSEFNSLTVAKVTGGSDGDAVLQSGEAILLPRKPPLKGISLQETLQT